MFNRTIEMNVVKKRKKRDDQPIPEPRFDERKVSNIVKPSLDGIGMTVMKIMAAYIALDTARKIAVNRLSK